MFALAAPHHALGADVTPALAARIADPATAEDTAIPVIVTLTDQVDAADYAGRRAALLTALHRTAAQTQPGVLDDVEGRARRFWLVNAVAVDATPDEVRTLAADPEVAGIDLDRPVHVAEAEGTAASELTPFPDAGDGGWGLAASRVTAAWSRFGVTGRGVRVGSIDTGVDASHADLAGKVVAWRDFIGGRATPYDDNGHGTHTIGTMVGGSAGGHPIGVAPDAQVVVAKAIAANGTGPGSALLAAAEWMTDPDGDPATADQPAVVNNSWSSENPNDTWFRALISRWLDLGIVPVFAAGNTGPGARTVGSPAGYPEALAVGALEQDSGLAVFSSQGPVDWLNLDGNGPAAGTTLTKPDVVAAGVGITSSVPGGYLSFSGTSMASPHVAGVVALMAEANPAIRGQAAADIIRRTAADMGAAGPDSRFGYGELDAEAAVAAAVGVSAQSALDTRFALTPPDTTRRLRLAYEVVATGGTYRWRVDGSEWSAPQEGRLTLTVREGRHTVEVQAWDAAGGTGDATPARHVVVVDRTPPTLGLRIAAQARGTVLRLRASDRLSKIAPGTVRWRVDGRTHDGITAFVSRGERTAHVRVSATDKAGNRAVLTRRVTISR